MLDETELVRRVINGDLKAFQVLVNQYEKLVYMVINRLVDNKEDTEDVCQEVFIKVYKNLAGFAFQSKLSTWIARIAYLTSINHLKKYRKKNTLRFPADLENYHFTEETPEGLAEKKSLSLYLNQLIDKMPPQFKLVLTLYHINEFSYQEIAAISGMPEGTVKAYLFRARKLLKEQIEHYMKKEIL